MRKSKLPDWCIFGNNPLKKLKSLSILPCNRHAIISFSVNNCRKIDRLSHKDRVCALCTKHKSTAGNC